MAKGKLTRKQMRNIRQGQTIHLIEANSPYDYSVKTTMVEKVLHNDGCLLGSPSVSIKGREEYYILYYRSNVFSSIKAANKYKKELEAGIHGFTGNRNPLSSTILASKHLNYPIIM